MCIAIYCGADHTLTESELRRGWSANPDGGGFAYVDRFGALTTYRTMELESYLSAYDEAKDRNPGSAFSVHMRIATSGTVSKRNVHPFRQDRATAWIHNGILPTRPIGKRSDTAVFVEDYLPQLGSLWMDNPYLVSIVEEYCAGSKLVGITTNPKAAERAYIINEADGFWSGSVWYSNRSCEAPSAKYVSAWRIPSASGADDVCLLCDSEQVVAYDARRGLVCMDCLACQGCGEDFSDCDCDRNTYDAGSLRLFAMTDAEYVRAE